MVWGVFPAAGTTLTWESAPGVPGLALGPQLNWSVLAIPAWSPTENKQPVTLVLNLVSFASLWRNKEWMIKASQEKQVVMCTNILKKISISITKVHSERKKNNKSVAKAAPVWHQFVEHRQPFRQNKNQTKNLPRNNLPTKKHCLISVLFRNFCSL